MDRNTIISIIILAVLVAFILFKIFSSNSKEKAKEKALEFLNSISDKFAAVIISHIQEIDFKNLDNLSDIEKKILDDTINKLYGIVQHELENYATSDSTRELIRVIINKDFLLSFIQQFFSENKMIQKVYSAKYNEAVLNNIQKSKKLEEDTSKKNFEYQTEDLSKIPAAPPIEVPEKPLNPQVDISDEELVYDKNDDSIEVISEDIDKVEEDIQKAINTEE
jgi:type II secretory pathway pseudopilin PulG